MEQGFGLASEAGCSTPFSFFKQDLAKRFLDFANVPDELVPGINYDEMACPKGKKASKKCKEKNGDRDNNDSPSKTGSNNNDKQPSQTAKNQPAKTDKPNCAAIGRDDLKALASEIQSDDAVQKRAIRTSLQTRRLELHARDYSEKPGQVCQKKKAGGGKTKGVEVKSKKYPSAGEDVMVRLILTAWDDSCVGLGKSNH